MKKNGTFAGLPSISALSGTSSISAFFPGSPSAPPFSNTKSGIFNGTTSKVNLGTTVNAMIGGRTTPFSVSLWMYPTATSTAMSVIANLSASPTHQGFSLELESRRVAILFGAEYVNNGIYAYTTAAEITLDAWNHVVVTYDGSGASAGFNFYVNRALKAKTQFYDSFTSGSAAPSTDLVVGSTEAVPSWDKFIGRLDELTFWSKELSLSEIEELAEGAGAGVPQDAAGTSMAANLAHWYRFEDDVQDSVGAAEGTATDITYSTDVPA